MSVSVGAQKVGRVDLAGAVVPALRSSAMRVGSMSKPTTGIPSLREGGRDGQADIAKADHREPAGWYRCLAHAPTISHTLRTVFQLRMVPMP